MEELTEERHREEVLPNLVRTFDAHCGVEGKLSL